MNRTDEHNIQKELLEALLERNCKSFSDLLDNNESIDVNFCYNYYPHYKTCLDIACSKSGMSKFVNILLLHKKADVNKINKTYFKAPLHFAAETGNVEIVKLLLAVDNINIDITSKGDTALHLAIKNIRTKTKKNFEGVIEQLVNTGADINKFNEIFETPVYLATERRLKSVFKILMKKEIDCHTRTYEVNQKSLGDMIKETFPDLFGKVSFTTGPKKPLNIMDLFYHLHTSNTDKFLEDFENIKERNLSLQTILDGNNEVRTLLQMACRKGMDEVVTVLLENQASPNLTGPQDNTNPLIYACNYDYQKILQQLLLNQNCRISNDPANDETLLQIATKKYTKNQQNSNCDYKKCIEILLGNEEVLANINHLDKNHNTALHHAVSGGNQDIVLTLLRNGAYIGIRNLFNVSPLTNISPKTLEMYLDECLTTGLNNHSNDEDYEIQFNYSFLAPPKRVINIDSINDNDQCLALETDALLYMTRNSNLKPLLKHPVITSFLFLKWQKIRCLLYPNIIFYLLFWPLLIQHILFELNSDDEKSDIAPAIGVQITRILTITGLVVLILRETIQITVSPKKYLKNIENWLEITLIIVTCMILFREWTLGISMQVLFSIAILLSSLQVVCIVGKFSTFSTYIVILKTVTWNFFKFLLFYLFLIIAFAFNFYTLFHTVKPKKDKNNETIAINPNKKNDDKEEKETDFFRNFGMSLFKTIIMLTGEFDAGNINFELFPVTSHVIFIIFVFMIPIVLFNLLNGLAVSDTQTIKANAELVGHISRIELISYFENIVLGDMSAYRNLMFAYRYVISKIPNSTLEFNEWLAQKIQNCCRCLRDLMCINLIRDLARKIKNCYFWLSVRMCNRRRAIARHICLFPNFLPMKKIGVKTNQFSKIVIYPIEEVSSKTLCSLNICNRQRMDKKTVKAACRIISERIEENWQL